MPAALTAASLAAAAVAAVGFTTLVIFVIAFGFGGAPAVVRYRRQRAAIRVAHFAARSRPIRTRHALSIAATAATTSAPAATT